MPTLVACLRRPVEGMWPRRVPTRFGPGTRLRRPKNQWNQGPLATPQAEMCPRTANSGLAGPAPEAAVDRPDLAEAGGEVLPRDAGAQHVGHGLDGPPQGGDVGLPDAGDGHELGVERRPGGIAQTVAGHSRLPRNGVGNPRTWRCPPTALPAAESVSRP